MADPVLPSQLGRYRPTAILGTGAMGLVYRAEDPVIGREVAIKVMRTETLDAETRADYLERFRREVQAAGRCSHAGIVAIYDYAENDGEPFIVMELVEGQSLLRLLRDPAARASLDPVGLMLQVLDALDCAHALAVVHRDIKPANILVTPGAQAKIADFGIARSSQLTTMTMAGGMIGTPSYMAPEQVTGQDVDHRADLFAAGAMLYEMLAGKPPFAGPNLAATIARVGGPEPADLAPVTAGSSANLAPILAKALAKPQAARFQSAKEFAAALRAGGTLPAPDDGTVILRTPIPAAPAETHWEPEFLKRLEQLLGQFLGPVARVLVGNAAKRATNDEMLIETLARGIAKNADRDTFLKRARSTDPGASGIRSLSGATAGGTRASNPGAASFTLAPGQPEAIQTALAFYLGPIARVLVKQAAAQARSADDLANRLAGQIKKPEDAAKFRKDLDAILSG